jgi:hypothetical protein
MAKPPHNAPVFPFLTSYDPPGTSEGTLDPLGLYQIADQLAVQLVPAVRERMQRIRFLTAIAVGALVTEGIEDDPSLRDASPYLVWEWLVIEALTRTLPDEPDTWGVPGSLVAKRAIHRHNYNYIDARSYLKTPRIFGFHGVYKRLAVHLGLVDVHLGPGPNAERLADAWARGLNYAGLRAVRPLLAKWSAAVARSMRERPPRTKPGWNSDDWSELALAFAPHKAKSKERQCLRSLLLAADEHSLGALPDIWTLQTEFDEEGYAEEDLHNLLERRAPHYKPLIAAIRNYEQFARSLQDSFDVLKAEAASQDAQGFAVTEIARDSDFQRCVDGLEHRFASAHQALGEVSAINASAQSLFAERFEPFAEALDARACALALCEHHVKVQRGKSASGKNPWFDNLGQGRIYIRHAYRQPRTDIQPGAYVHDYRGLPIHRFRNDLS